MSRYRITLDYETPEQLKMALSMFRATAPQRFRLRIRDGKRVVWREDGQVYFRPEPKE